MDLRAVHVAVERMMADQDDKADNERSAVDDGENMIHLSRGTPGVHGQTRRQLRRYKTVGGEDDDIPTHDTGGSRTTGGKESGEPGGEGSETETKERALTNQTSIMGNYDIILQDCRKYCAAFKTWSKKGTHDGD